MMKDTLPEPVFLSAPKAATLCGVSRNTVCCWIRDGKLPSYRTAGGKYLIRPVDLISFMEENKMYVSQALVDLAQEDEDNAAGADGLRQNRETSSEPSILIVDDDPNARSLAVRSLQKMGTPIFEAEDGFEAMHMLTKHPDIGIVILDLVMPGQDGIKTYAQIREQNKSLPVIVVTGYPPDEAKQAFGDVEPDLVLTKPYQPGHLLDAARAFLSDVGI